MVKKINKYEDWLTAEKASRLLSDKLGFPIESRYVRQLAKSKRQPVRTESLGYHQLYNRQDLEQVVIKKKQLSKKQDS
jgi:hypothetical protein